MKYTAKWPCDCSATIIADNNALAIEQVKAMAAVAQIGIEKYKLIDENGKLIPIINGVKKETVATLVSTEVKEESKEEKTKDETANDSNPNPNPSDGSNLAQSPEVGSATVAQDAPEAKGEGSPRQDEAPSRVKKK